MSLIWSRVKMVENHKHWFNLCQTLICQTSFVWGLPSSASPSTANRTFTFIYIGTFKACSSLVSFDNSFYTHSTFVAGLLSSKLLDFSVEQTWSNLFYTNNWCHLYTINLHLVYNCKCPSKALIHFLSFSNLKNFKLPFQYS